jgi:hypothetical protein
MDGYELHFNGSLSHAPLHAGIGQRSSGDINDRRSSVKKKNSPRHKRGIITG